MWFFSLWYWTIFETQHWGKLLHFIYKKSSWKNDISFPEFTVSGRPRHACRNWFINIKLNLRNKVHFISIYMRSYVVCLIITKREGFYHPPPNIEKNKDTFFWLLSSFWTNKFLNFFTIATHWSRQLPQPSPPPTTDAPHCCQ